MYRVSVTTIEKFRRYMCEESPYDTEQSLLETLQGLFIGNDKTMVGGAFHKLIEGDYRKEKDRVEADNIWFTKEQAQVAFDYKKQHDFMIHEISIAKTYCTNFFPIQVSGRIDGAEGLNIHDTKTKFRYPSVQEYLSSSQWKFYLDMMDAQSFYYDVFEVRNFKELGGQPLTLSADVQFIPHEPLECIRYETMTQDIHQLINQFLEYLHNRNIVHLLKPALETPEFNF